MVLPDCRNDDCYNEDFLNAMDKSFVKGMDYALEQIEDLFLSNLGAYKNQLTETLPEGKTAGENEAFASRKDLLDILQENTEILAAVIQNWHEISRNEMIISMINDYEDEEFKELRKNAMQNHPNKEYYDSRKFLATGEKKPSET